MANAKIDLKNSKAFMSLLDFIKLFLTDERISEDIRKEYLEKYESISDKANKQ